MIVWRFFIPFPGKGTSHFIVLSFLIFSYFMIAIISFFLLISKESESITVT